MSKKVLIIVVLTALIIGGVGGYLIISSRNQKAPGESVAPTEANKAKSKTELSYEDESGFSFKYPKEITVKDVTPDDDDYYSSLELSKGKEKLLISVRDTESKKPEDWVKKDAIYKTATLVGAADMGGLSAKQFAGGNKLISVVIDNGILYLIEGPKDGGYWEDVQNSVISSFKLVTQEESSGASGGEVIYEEEEVIE